MAIISDFEEEDRNETQPKASASSSSSSSKPFPFTATFDPSNPVSFLEKVFDFIAQESDFLEKVTVEKEINSVVLAAKKKKKMMDEQKASEEKQKVEKSLKEEKAKAKEEDKKGESAARGKIMSLVSHGVVSLFLLFRYVIQRRERHELWLIERLC